MSVIWHDLECGSYTEDLALWLGLADRYGDPVLDVGAGTGRTALHLARAGHRVTALDHDPELVAELGRRARGLPLDTAVGDARTFALGRRYALCIVPMQTIQLLGGTDGRLAFLACARDHLRPGGVLAIALADELDVFEVKDGAQPPLPDVCEIDGVVYYSRPTAVRSDGDGFVLERMRETVTPDGHLSALQDLIRLDRLDPAVLEREGVAVGLRTAAREYVPETSDYVGSVVVMLSA